MELCLQATSSWLVGQIAAREEWSTLRRTSGARCAAKPGTSMTHQWRADSLTVEDPISSPPRTSMVSATDTPGSIRLNAVEWSQLWPSVHTDPSETKPATLHQLLVLSAQVRQYKISYMVPCTHFSLSLSLFPSQEVWKSNWLTVRMTVQAESRFVTGMSGIQCVTRTGL